MCTVLHCNTPLDESLYYTLTAVAGVTGNEWATILQFSSLYSVLVIIIIILYNVCT